MRVNILKCRRLVLQIPKFGGRRHQVEDKLSRKKGALFLKMVFALLNPKQAFELSTMYWGMHIHMNSNPHLNKAAHELKQAERTGLENRAKCVILKQQTLPYCSAAILTPRAGTPRCKQQSPP